MISQKIMIDKAVVERSINDYKRNELLRIAAATADTLDGVMQGVADLLRELIKEIK